MTERSIIGSEIRRARLSGARSLTLSEVAQRIEAGVSTLSQYESGRTDPPASKLLRLAGALPELDLNSLARRFHRERHQKRGPKPKPSNGNGA